MTIGSARSLLSRIILSRRLFILQKETISSITTSSSSSYMYCHTPNYTHSHLSHPFSTNTDSEFQPDPASTISELSGLEFDSNISNAVASAVTEQDSIFPIRALISLLDGYHDFTGFPWWVIISSSVFAFRISMFPLIILQLTKLKHIQMCLPKLPPPFPAPFSGKSYIGQFSKFTKQRKAIGCPPMIWHIVPAAIQAPCFILGVTTIRRMAVNHHPGFDYGGALWFQDLTQMPHGYLGAVFPFLISGLHITNVALTFPNMSVNKWPDRMRGMLRSYKVFLDGLFLPILFVGFYIPYGGSVYWVANSVLNLIQNLVIANASVRNYFGLPLKDGPAKMLTKDQNIQVDDGIGVNLVGTSMKQPKKVSVKDLSPKDLVNLSIQMLAKGDRERALRILRLSLNKDPEHIRSLILLGQTLLQEGLLAEAVEHLDHAVSNILLTGPPSKVEEIDQLIIASMWCGVAYIRNGKNAEGILHLERIGHMNEPAEAKSKAHYYDGLLMLASALVNEGRKPDAEKYLRKAVAYNSAYNVYLEQLQNEDDDSVSDLVNNKRTDQ